MTRPDVDAPGAGLGAGGRAQGQGNVSPDSANREATAVVRAALLGIECRPLGAGAWLLRHARGAVIGTVQGLDALAAAVAGFEAARDDVRELVQRMRGAS